jgi:hypothetical protein
MFILTLRRIAKKTFKKIRIIRILQVKFLGTFLVNILDKKKLGQPSLYL